MSQLSSRVSIRRQRNYKQALARLETLEPRTLLSASIDTYGLPAGVQAFGGTYDDNNTLWLFDQTSLLRVNADHSVTQFAIPGAVPNADGSPVSVIAGHNGTLYVTDFFGAIDEFDIASQTFTHQTTWDVGNNIQYVPRNVTLTGDGSLWFVTLGSDDSTTTSDVRTSYVARYDTTTHTVSPFTAVSTPDINPTDSEALYISAHGADGVYVGMDAVEFVPQGGPARFGTNRVADISYSGSITVNHIWSADTPDTDANAYGYLTGVATGADGSVWYSLANVNDPSSVRTVHPADRLVHGVYNSGTNHLDQTGYTLPGATDATPVAIGNIAMDDADRLWFNEFQGTQMGYFDTSSLQYAPTPLLNDPSSLQLDQGGSVSSIFTGHGNNQVSMIVFDGTPDDGSPLVQATVNDVTPPTFANLTATLVGNHVEDAAQTLNVSFTASAPVGGTYHVLINWGDGSTAQSVDAALVGGQYTASKAHTYATQGTYAVSVTVSDGSATTHNLTINPVISDVPLTITSFAVNPVVARIVLTTLTFTDDTDATAGQFSVNVNWGDSSASAGLVVRDPTTAGRFIVIALHQYRRRGTYNVTATVTTTEANASITSNVISHSVTV